MNLDIVLIDVLMPDGVLTSYKVRSTTGPRGLSIDRLRDIHSERFGDANLDIGGTRIYNALRCSIDKLTSRLRTFTLGDDGHSFRFQFEHNEHSNRTLQRGSSWNGNHQGVNGRCQLAEDLSLPKNYKV